MIDIKKVLKALVGEVVMLVEGDYCVSDYLFQPSYLNGVFEIYNTDFDEDDVVSITIDQFDIIIKLG